MSSELGESSTGVSFVSFGGCGNIADHRLPRSRQSGRPGGLVSARGVFRGGGWARLMVLSCQASSIKHQASSSSGFCPGPRGDESGPGQDFDGNNEVVFEGCGDGGSHGGIFAERERVWRGQCRGIDWVGLFLQGMGDWRWMASTDFVYGTFVLGWHPSSTTDLSRWRSESRFAAAKLSARLASQRSGHLFAKASTSRHNHIAAASGAGLWGRGCRDIVEASLLGERQRRKDSSLDVIAERKRPGPPSPAQSHIRWFARSLCHPIFNLVPQCQMQKVQQSILYISWSRATRSKTAAIANWSVCLDKTRSAPGPGGPTGKHAKKPPQLPRNSHTCTSSMGLAAVLFTPPAQM